MRVLERLVELGFKKDHVLKCINTNKHNHITTSYYLLLKRAEQEGLVSDDQFEYFDDKRIAKIAQERLASQQSISGQPIQPESAVKQAPAMHAPGPIERAPSHDEKPLSMTQPIQKQEFNFQERAPKHVRQESAYGDYNTVNPQAKAKDSPLNRTANAQDEFANNMTSDLNSLNEAEPYRTTAHEKNLNKTVKIVSAQKKFESSKLVSAGYQRPIAGPKNLRKAAADSSIERPKIQIYMNNSNHNTEKTAGFNVSYDSSFSAIKNNIFNFKGSGANPKGPQTAGNSGPAPEIVGAEDVPNKPKDKSVQDKIIIKAMHNQLNVSNHESQGRASSQYASNFNQTQEVKNLEPLDDMEERKSRKNDNYHRHLQEHPVPGTGAHHVYASSFPHNRQSRSRDKKSEQSFERRSQPGNSKTQFSHTHTNNSTVAKVHEADLYHDS